MAAEHRSASGCECSALPCVLLCHSMPDAFVADICALLHCFCHELWCVHTSGNRHPKLLRAVQAW
jgi:hypothetical protein